MREQWLDLHGFTRDLLRLLHRALVGDLRRWARSWHAFAHAQVLERVGCCTCGGPSWDVAYFDALVAFPGKCTDVPDWVACRACHEATTPDGQWFRSLRWIERADAERMGVL